MATTLRETPASNRSESNILDRDGQTPLPPGDPSPLTYTAPRHNCQEISNVDSFIQSRLLPLIGTAVDIALDSHLGPGRGSTVSVIRGNLVGQPLYAVSIFSGRTVELDAPPTWQQLFAFAILYRDLLAQPEFALGTWFDKHRKLHVLDVVICIPNLQAALALGHHFGQSAIYDLERQQEIAIPVQSRLKANGHVGRQQ